MTTEQRVKHSIVRIDRSPMNAKVWIAELACGHDACLYRKPKATDKLYCEKCESGAKR